MMKKMIALVLMAMLLLTGCQTNGEQSVAADATEPTATYDWMAGESIVTPQRMGLKRMGTNNTDYAIAPNGVYFMYSTMGYTDIGEQISYVLYSDYGSDTFIKLCGRADCDHNNTDCNAYIADGNNIYYYDGYIYAVSGSSGSRNDTSERAGLIRMNMDGSNRVTVLDLDQFAQDLGCDFATCNMIDSGECLFSIHEWVEVPAGPNEQAFTSEWVASYRYALDGSMEEPLLIESEGGHLYHCGDVFLTLMNGAQEGGYDGYDFSYWDWDMETDTITYLTDHPGIAGFYGKEYGYYFRDGAVIRLNYETREEERIIETGLEGDYFAMYFPDCIVIASGEMGTDADNQIYIYNWAYELVDTVELPFNGIPYDQSLIAETAERLIFSNELISRVPKYYIEKSELGTGNAKVHAFKLPDLSAADLEYWEDQEWLNNG